MELRQPKAETVARPSECPACHGHAIETLAKVITPTSMWRCRSCEKTWTISSLKLVVSRP